MSISLRPLHLWIAVDNAGGVITAHSDCPNGYQYRLFLNQIFIKNCFFFSYRLCNTCSHIGALLYCVAQIKEEACLLRVENRYGTSMTTAGKLW
jgi:hypothetical protein